MTAATTALRDSRQPVVLVAGGLEVAFEWIGDRWRHRVTHGGRSVAESVEGPGPDGDPRWPASPAIQEVSASVAAGRPVILAVGSAGRSHFSASAAADPDRSDTVLVEVACRVREQAGWLGATYRVGSGEIVRVAAAVDAPPPHTVCWSWRIGPHGVEVGSAAAASPTPAGVSEPLRSAGASITFRGRPGV